MASRIPGGALPGGRGAAPANSSYCSATHSLHRPLPATASRCPSATGIKNKDEETPGQILGWTAPWDSAEEGEEDKVSREHNEGRGRRESWRTSGGAGGLWAT